jgi:NAD(P)-dependent dehydrogenase (short-subunit alcohol dehydrogenase family)
MLLVLITGVSPNGLGAAISNSLVAHSPSLLILAGHTIERVHAVASSLPAQCPAVKILCIAIDLANRRSILCAADEIKLKCNGRVDILINNAGIMCLPEWTLNEEGVEMHLATNYLGHFLLTNLLRSMLEASPAGGRVVNVSSSAHIISPFRFSDPNFHCSTSAMGLQAIQVAIEDQPDREACQNFDIPWTIEYEPLVAYAQSKTAVSLHAVALAQDGLVAFSVDPGGIVTRQGAVGLEYKEIMLMKNLVINTDLWREMPTDVVEHILSSIVTKTHIQGSATILVAALDPELNRECLVFAQKNFQLNDNMPGYSGAYLENCAVSSAAGFAADRTAAAKLWKWSAEQLK